MPPLEHAGFVSLAAVESGESKIRLSVVPLLSLNISELENYAKSAKQNQGKRQENNKVVHAREWGRDLRRPIRGCMPGMRKGPTRQKNSRANCRCQLAALRLHGAKLGNDPQRSSVGISAGAAAFLHSAKRFASNCPHDESMSCA